MAKCRQLRERHPTQGRTERRLQLTDSLGRHGAERVLDLLDIVSRGNPGAEPGITHGAGVLPGSGVGDCGQPRSPLGHRGTIEGCQCCRLKPHLCARRLRACGELDQPVLYLRQRHRPRGPGVIQAGDVGVELPASGSTARGPIDVLVLLGIVERRDDRATRHPRLLNEVGEAMFVQVADHLAARAAGLRDDEHPLPPVDRVSDDVGDGLRLAGPRTRIDDDGLAATNGLKQSDLLGVGVQEEDLIRVDHVPCWRHCTGRWRCEGAEHRVGATRTPMSSARRARAAYAGLGSKASPERHSRTSSLCGTRTPRTAAR